MPVAHGLLGASIVAALLPPAPLSVRWIKPFLFGGILANAADLDFLLVFALDSKAWHRGFTHSILFALLILGLFIFYYGKLRRREGAAFGLAYASHTVLDFLTTRTGGAELFFPFSNERFGARWFGLSEAPSQMTVFEIVQALSIEFAIFFSLLLIVLTIRKIIFAAAPQT